LSALEGNNVTDLVIDDAAAERDRPAIPYLSFETFRNFIDSRAGRPLPPRVDRSLMMGMAGGTQTHLLAALSTFGLINQQRQVTPRLVEAARLSDAQRPAFFAAMVHEVYPHQVALADAHATADQLAESFRELTGYQGSTLRKAITFFLNMARYAEVPLSPYFRAPAQATGSGRPRAPKRSAPPPPRTTATFPAAPGSAPIAGGAISTAESRTVQLHSGGTVTVACSTSFLSLSRQDRDFVFNLVDQLLEYQDRPSPSARVLEEDRRAEANA
jgi:hypothetical protein